MYKKIYCWMLIFAFGVMQAAVLPTHDLYQGSFAVVHGGPHPAHPKISVVSNEFSLEDLEAEYIADEVDTISKKSGKKGEMFVGVILYREGSGEESQVYSKYFLSARGSVDQKLHRTIQKVHHYQIIQTESSHIFPALMQLLWIKRGFRVYKIAVSGVFCLGCDYLKRSVAPHHPVKGSKGGCVGQAPLWPLPEKALRYLNSVFTKKGKPIQETAGLLKHVAAISLERTQELQKEVTRFTESSKRLLEIVERLRQENNPEMDMLEWAARGGHKALFDYIVKSYKVQPNQYALRGAAMGGHKALFDYIVKSYKVQPNEDALRGADLGGHKALFDYICKKYNIRPNQKIASWAFRNGFTDMVDHLCKIYGLKAPVS